MTLRIDLVVEHEDGTVDKLTADMRDVVRFERDQRCAFSDARERGPIAATWALAYYASQRTGLVGAKTDLDGWQDTVLDVSSVSGDVDPTKPEATGVRRSSSRSRPAKASTR